MQGMDPIAPAASPSLTRRLARAALALLLLAPAAFAGDGLETVRLFVEGLAVFPAARVEVTVGQPDPRLVLAPCARAEPFLPTGSRLWGRSVVGLRCVEGARWSITLPVEVRVFGPGLVATRALPANQPVSPADAELRDIELSREGAPVFADTGSLAGKLATRPLAAGQALRSDYFRPAPVIAQGDAVVVVATGPGFSASTQGQALQHAGEGQAVRARTEAGRVVTGIARKGHVVEIPLADAAPGR
jgi:flagella basal body P-ring formation protein FlgA